MRILLPLLFTVLTLCSSGCQRDSVTPRGTQPQSTAAEAAAQRLQGSGAPAEPAQYQQTSRQAHTQLLGQPLALRRGVNLSNWFTHRQAGQDTSHFPDERDYRRLRQMGVDHVRIAVDPLLLFQPQSSIVKNPHLVAELVTEMKAIRAAGLKTIINLQPPSEAKHALRNNRQTIYTLIDYWHLLGNELAGFGPEHLVLEPLNEPEIEDADQWAELQKQLVRGVRSIWPHHTLILAGHRWSSPPELLALQPIADRNVIYSFHFYEPHNFTHQGAGWGWELWPSFKHFPYPSSPEAVAPVMAKVPAKAHEHLAWYGEQRWNKAKMNEELGKVASWSRRHGVPVICTEFGVYRPNVLPEHRGNWLFDVRTSLEAANIGWTVWDYAEDFGLVSGNADQRVPDRDAISALGLRWPE